MELASLHTRNLPSRFLDQLTLERLTPLAAHAMRFDLFSAVDLLRDFALFFPVGALLAVWPLRREGRLSGPLPGIYLVCLIEAGQLFLSERLFDTTDALVGISAVLIGWIIVRRSGFSTYGELVPSSVSRRGRSKKEPRSRSSRSPNRD